MRELLVTFVYHDLETDSVLRVALYTMFTRTSCRSCTNSKFWLQFGAEEGLIDPMTCMMLYATDSLTPYVNLLHGCCLSDVHCQGLYSSALMMQVCIDCAGCVAVCNCPWPACAIDLLLVEATTNLIHSVFCCMSMMNVRDRQ